MPITLSIFIREIERTSLDPNRMHFSLSLIAIETHVVIIPIIDTCMYILITLELYQSTRYIEPSRTPRISSFSFPLPAQVHDVHWTIAIVQFLRLELRTFRRRATQEEREHPLLDERDEKNLTFINYAI